MNNYLLLFYLKMVSKGHTEYVQNIAALPAGSFSEFSTEEDPDVLWAKYSKKYDPPQLENHLTENSLNILKTVKVNNENNEEVPLISVIPTDILKNLNIILNMDDIDNSVKTTVKRTIKEVTQYQNKLDKYNKSFQEGFKTFKKSTRIPGKAVFLLWLADNLNNKKELERKIKELERSTTTVTV